MKFTPDFDIPDLNGKVIFVTGGNIGLGRETIFQLAKHNPSRIFLAARNGQKAEAAIEELKRDLPDAKTAIDYIELDLTSFNSIREAAAKLAASSDKLDLLINNAGIVGHPPSTTTEGYEIHFGANHVGHALLTRLLLPILKRTASGSSGADVRVVTVSSDGYRNAPSKYPFSSLKGDGSDLGWWARYAISKLANIHFTQVLARRNSDITCVAVHPGAVDTNIASSFIQAHPWLGPPLRFVVGLFLVTVQQGALNQLWAVTAKDVRNGSYYNPIGEEINDSKINNSHAAEELWKWTEEQLAG